MLVYYNYKYYKIKQYLEFKFIFFKKQLLFFKKYKCGRNNLGKQTIFTNCKIKKKLYINTIIEKKWILPFFFNFILLKKYIFKFYFINQNYYKKFCLILTNCVNYFNIYIYINKYNLNILHFNNYFLYYKNFEKICLILNSNKKKIQYIKTSGAYGIIVLKNYLYKKCLVLLPSNLYKLFNLLQICSKNTVYNFNKKLFIKHTAGFFFNMGKKPNVRGIIMNAVDHPHGGNCRVVKYSKTPWGKTTIF